MFAAIFGASPCIAKTLETLCCCCASEEVEDDIGEIHIIVRCNSTCCSNYEIELKEDEEQKKKKIDSEKLTPVIEEQPKGSAPPPTSSKKSSPKKVFCLKSKLSCSKIKDGDDKTKSTQ
tara:strand:- start:262 stop:618 length:357 start_codon:yes stop_codon:yes gene_type:complete